MIKLRKKVQEIELAGEDKSMKVPMIIHAHFFTTMGKTTPKTIIFCTHYFTFNLQTTTNSRCNKLQVL